MDAVDSKDKILNNSRRQRGRRSLEVHSTPNVKITGSPSRGLFILNNPNPTPPPPHVGLLALPVLLGGRVICGALSPIGTSVAAKMPRVIILNVDYLNIGC